MKLPEYMKRIYIMEEIYMKQKKSRYEIIGAIMLLIAIFLIVVNIGISGYLQYKSEVEGLIPKYIIITFVGIFIIASIMWLIEKKTNIEFPRNIVGIVVVFLVALLGTFNSALFIYYNSGNPQFDWFPITNDTNALSLGFFFVYTAMHQGFIIDWWYKLRNPIGKFFMMIIIEIPNFVSWWVLAFSAPFFYTDMESKGHLWMTGLTALIVVLTLTGMNLIKNSGENNANEVA